MIDSLLLASSALGYTALAYLGYRICLLLLRIRWARYAYPQVDVQPSTTDLDERCRGVLLGSAIGDAVNLMAESLPRWLVRLRYPGGPGMRRGIVRFARRAGDVSDDTQLTICVARSVAPDGTYDHQRFIEELAQWSQFRIGAGRASSLAAIRARRRRAVTAVASEGNGVAIRIAPLVIATMGQGEEALASLVEQNGRATHASDAAIQAALLMALLLRAALRLPRGAFADSQQQLSVLRAACDASGFDFGDLRLEPADSEAHLQALLQQVGTSGHVHQCVPAALLVLLYHRLDFIGAMHSVFRAGGDTDSIGAMVGALVGAQLGAEGLPASWCRTVQHRNYLCWLAHRLAVPAPARRCMGQIVCVTDDVARRPVDVVVNAWNRNLVPAWLLLPQGVSRALRRAGGGLAIRNVGRRAPLPLGRATETCAGTLHCRWVVHVAGINLLWCASEAAVRQATQSALSLSRWLGARSVALPLIGAGSGGMNADAVEAILKEELDKQRHHFDRLEITRRASTTPARSVDPWPRFESPPVRE